MTNSTPDSDSNSTPKVAIYIDGSCNPNPGAAGIGAVLIFGLHRKELCEPIGHSSSNGAEIMAAVIALKTLKQPCTVTVYSDSQYLVRTMTGEYNRGANMALWIMLDQAAQPHVITWKWVRGHNGNLHNERAHSLAEQAMRISEQGEL